MYLLEVFLLKEDISNVEVSQGVVWLNGDGFFVVSHSIDQVTGKLMDHTRICQ